MTTKREALELWAPDWPRRIGRNQQWASDIAQAVQILDGEEARDGGKGFMSTYAFPRGHTSDGNIPAINTLFIDFDFDEGEYERGSGDREAWQRDMSHLLVRARRVANTLLGGNYSSAWRASLSGHKGIHLFLDFPTLSPELGTFDQYVAGLNEYASDLVDNLSDESGIDDLHEYVDVTSSDLSRLCRVPNTVHHGATESFGEDRYCVAISLENLAALFPGDYVELTRERRALPRSTRDPSEDAGDIIERYVMSSSGEQTYNYTSGSTSSINWDRVQNYKENVNESLDLEDARFLTSDRPCVWEFHLRDDKFDYGNQSHEFETHAIAVLLQHEFPIDVIKEFFADTPSYDERYTERRIEELIARDFSPYSVQKLLRRAPEFSGYPFCKRCQRVLDDHPELQSIHD